jgi:hypothetical protein
MGILGFSAKIVADIYERRIESWRKNAVRLQYKVLNNLVKKAQNTIFGRDHSFSAISDYEQFRKQVPVRDYESMRTYLGRVRLGEKNVLWPGRPAYFAMTSGTTSGGKYIPVTKDSIPNHIESTRIALLNYIKSTGKTEFLNGKYIFLSGSPRLEYENGIPAGRLSGIVNHHVPGYLKRNQLPTWEVNCIEDWEKKLDGIIEQTINENMSLISGIPSWVEMYFEKLLERSGKLNILDLFPGFGLYVHGGVNFEPYKNKFNKLIGGEVDSLETFPASEGFIAFQDRFPGNGLILIPDAGIFYEFIPLDKIHDEDPERIPLEGVAVGVNYALILNTNAGMWGYSIGDTVKFISKDPYLLTVTGRVSQYLSAFGEHVIAEEADAAMVEACSKTGVRITEFSVAPLVDNPDGKPCHEWFVEFSKEPSSVDEFGRELDLLMRKKNHYYDYLIKGKILQPLIVRQLPHDSFNRYMSSIGKLGGQNKIPRLRNDRDIADILSAYLKE